MLYSFRIFRYKMNRFICEFLGFKEIYAQGKHEQSIQNKMFEDFFLRVYFQHVLSVNFRIFLRKESKQKASKMLCFEIFSIQSVAPKDSTFN